jgi:hypothetical protein
VCDRNSVLDCEGLPYHFEMFEAQVRFRGPVRKHRSEIPLQNWIVRFPE